MGNKIDKSQNRVVSAAEASDLAMQYGIVHCEVTATNTSLLNDLFTNMCQSTKIIHSEIEKAKTGMETKIKAPVRLEESMAPPPPEQKKGCC